MAVTIRPSTDGDARQVRALVTAAFGGDGTVAALVDALRSRPDRQADLVAEADDAVVGHTHLSVSWVDAPDRLVEVSVLSPLAVAPDRQRQGIGRRLVEAALATADELGAPLVFLEGDPRYYGRIGWRPGGDFGFVPPSERIPPAAFQVVPLGRYDPTTMRGRLVYNDTFWAFDCVGLRQ